MSTQYGPWNPGISSELPAELLPLATIFRPENVFTSVPEAREFRDFTGLPFEELITFRPERLVVHELLVRVMADFSVPDGPRQEDLGIQFRRMVDTIFVNAVAAHMPEVVAEFSRLRQALSDCIALELAATQRAAAPGTSARSGLAGLWDKLRGASVPAPTGDDAWSAEEDLVRTWSARARTEPDPLHQAALRALARVVSAIRIRQERIRLDHPLVGALACGMASNEHCSQMLGRLITPWIRAGAAAAGYRPLPAQKEPVVMNTKGASASGKSSMRPLQKQLAGKIGVDWREFALISPDIWRKHLLDYGSLGDAFKYAGAFTGHEIGIIDHKLDGYMARKAERGEMSHLLIDRFRFDSFAPDSTEAGSNLLTRFGHLVYMFFMITPPHETVERAWKRGLNVGRFKAVDDLLAHNVEAFSGMPGVFFTWALTTGKSVHYEFLDNSVPLGEPPRTAAFGWNGEMNILDVKCLLDIDRYRKINIDATSPASVYPDGSAMAPENNTRFLRECAQRIPRVNFVDRNSGRIYARLESGRLTWTDAELLDVARRDPETQAGLLAVAPEAANGQPGTRVESGELYQALEAARFHTIGAWGDNPLHQKGS